VIRAILFDVGGVLEIVDPPAATARWEQRLGLSPGEIDDRLDDVWAAGTVGAISLDEVHRGIGDRLRLDPTAVDALMEDLWTEYLGRINTELVEFLRRLRRRYRTGIITNSFVGAREREQERYALSDLVDVILYSHEVGVAKPDPRIYQRACELLGVEPHEAIFVDDSPEALDGAEAVGMHGVLYRSTPQAIEHIEALLRGH
jgi:putative hydrolase of the HAD superfamily